MTKIMQINSTQAVADPETAFEHPGEIADHVGLTRGQKIAALERWIFSVRARLDAVSEGMTSRPDGAYSADSQLAGELERTLEALRSPPPAA